MKERLWNCNEFEKEDKAQKQRLDFCVTMIWVVKVKLRPWMITIESQLIYLVKFMTNWHWIIATCEKLNNTLIHDKHILNCIIHFRQKDNFPSINNTYKPILLLKREVHASNLADWNETTLDMLECPYKQVWGMSYLRMDPWSMWHCQNPCPAPAGWDGRKHGWKWG